jgi:hypothetical protein
VATYKVLADNIAGKNPGDSITDDELQGINIEALLESGHIAKTTNNKKAED